MSLASALLLGACASGFDPKPPGEVPFLERAQTQEKDGITVTAAVPSAEETRQLFGASLYKRGVQPVWLEIQNGTDEPIAFLPYGVDDDYLTPIEAASMNPQPKYRRQIEEYFFQNGVETEILGGGTRAGFIFTNLDEGTKAFNVDIVGDGRGWQYTFFIPVPGLKIDHHEVDFDKLYAEGVVVNYQEKDQLIQALEQLPCCTTDKSSEGSGDPLNLVVVGEPFDVYYAFLRAGWDETEVVTAASGWKTAMSFISGGEYRYSPVSSLYVFQRRQDVALQKIRQNIHERNHLRLWMAPIKFDGTQVWIGQISRDIGVRFTAKTITTHKIDPDVDDTREFLLENLAYSQALAAFGYVGGAIAAPIDAPRGNLTGDSYFTDGLRLVLWVSDEPTDIRNIEYREWKEPDS